MIGAEIGSLSRAQVGTLVYGMWRGCLGFGKISVDVCEAGLSVCFAGFSLTVTGNAFDIRFRMIVAGSTMMEIEFQMIISGRVFRLV